MSTDIVIVVEDGTGKSNANSYVSVADARIYAKNRGVILSDDDDVIAAWLINASDYLLTFECEYVGYRTNPTQALSWPRTDAISNCRPIVGPDEIPAQIVFAQCQCVIAQHNGIDLMPTYTASDFVTEETVGPLTTKYADPLAVGLKPTITSVDALLAPLFGTCASSGIALRTVRV
uniref:Virion structural protein n=1 Tax=Pseudomonas phage Pavpe01 TaxID=3138545 RepID=A0AAU6W0F9_9VIRU